MWELHGVISLQVLAIPTRGLLKSSSVRPTARSIARLGARTSPSVIILLRLLYVRVDPLLSDMMAIIPFYYELRCSFLVFPQGLLDWLDCPIPLAKEEPLSRGGITL
jgi:hypothetical protein